MYSRVLMTRHSYVLYYGSNQFTVIPKRAFQTADEQRRFEEMLARHVPAILQ
jgi:hypothetical protein